MPAAAIGILALQGDFTEHQSAVEKLGYKTKLIRSLVDTENVAGLILPGGESTTIGKLLISTRLATWIKRQAKLGMPVYGTCAGCILIAQRVDSPYSLKLIDITVQRNAYGRQLDSFVDNLTVSKKFVGTLHATSVSGVFIRAPKITAVGRGVTVLVAHHHSSVLVQQKNILAGTFHPELMREKSSVHSYFINLALQWNKR